MDAENGDDDNYGSTNDSRPETGEADKMNVEVDSKDEVICI